MITEMDKHQAIRIALRGIHGSERAKIALNLMYEPSAIIPVMRARLLAAAEARRRSSASYNQRYYQSRKDKGICLRCPRKTDGQHVNCLHCRLAIKEGK